MRKLIVIFTLALLTLPLAADSLDVTPIEIISPGQMEFGPFNPKARYTERAGNDTTITLLKCQIESITSHIVVYRDSFPKVFLAYDSFTALFRETYLVPGGYMITFWAENVPTWENISHPPLSDTFEYIDAVEEQVVDREFRLEPVTSTGPQVILRYRGNSQGLRVLVFDALGRRVDEICTSGIPGYITWGESHPRGVYFIRPILDKPTHALKVILCN